MTEDMEAKLLSEYAAYVAARVSPVVTILKADGFTPSDILRLAEHRGLIKGYKAWLRERSEEIERALTNAIGTEDRLALNPPLSPQMKGDWVTPEVVDWTDKKNPVSLGEAAPLTRDEVAKWEDYCKRVKGYKLQHNQEMLRLVKEKKALPPKTDDDTRNFAEKVAAIKDVEIIRTLLKAEGL